VTVVVGDGESETGRLATSWHGNKFLNPVRDGAVLPIIHLNGYKIANPTILARIPADELEMLFKGLGWTPYVVEGDDPAANAPADGCRAEHCVTEIRAIQAATRANPDVEPERPRWPNDRPADAEGWTCPKELDGHKLEGSWRRTRFRFTDPVTNPAHLKMVEAWMRSYKPEELFDESGALIAELKAMARRGRAGLRRIRMRMAGCCGSRWRCRTSRVYGEGGEAGARFRCRRRRRWRIFWAM